MCFVHEVSFQLNTSSSPLFIFKIKTKGVFRLNFIRSVHQFICSIKIKLNIYGASVTKLNRLLKIRKKKLLSRKSQSSFVERLNLVDRLKPSLFFLTR